MSENPISNEELLRLLLSFVPENNEALKEKALLLATFGNLKEAIAAMEKYIALAKEEEMDLTKDTELLEKMKSYLN